MKKVAVLASFLFLFLSYPALVSAQVVTITMNAPSNLLVTNFGTLMSGAIGLILVVSALACFFFLIYGGISWITSGGDKSGVEAAQKRIQAALIGLFIVFAAWALMTIVGGFFGFDISKLSFPTGHLPRCIDLPSGVTPKPGENCLPACAPGTHQAPPPWENIPCLPV